MDRKAKPKFKVGQVLAVASTVGNPHPRPRYVYVDNVTDTHGKPNFGEEGFFYQDAAVTATIGWPERPLRRLARKEAGL